MLIWLALVVAVLYFTINLIIKVFGSSKTNDSSTNEVCWFGRGPSAQDNEDESIRPFKLEVPDEILADLMNRLRNTRYEEPLENSNFNYGFNSTYLRKVVEYWHTKYDWRSQETKINEFPHFKTKIEGIDIHFIHIKPVIGENKKVKTLPLLMTHGWPGSFYEFYKIIPLLTKGENFAFEVICPSIPGYGFSEAPHQKGFDLKAAARIFVTLMKRLGHDKFYVQGGDWGAVISVVIGKYYPSSVTGVHVNMFPYLPKGWDAVKAVAVSFFPSLVSPAEFRAFFPFWQKMRILLRETGYMHLQSTKPDTLGCSISDSPAGLAAYILEKFSSWTNMENVNLPDGGLTEKFSMDELLTNVTIYWVSNSFTSSARLYKESISDQSHEKVPLQVPCGLALFPHELIMIPRMLTSGQVKKLVTYRVMPRGGHFAAMEEPELLAEDFRRFVAAVQGY